MKQRVLLILTGSIALSKVPDIIMQLQEQACDVTCVLTSSAQQFVERETLSILTGNPVYTDLFNPEAPMAMEHIQLSREADVVVVVPATANILAKMAHGYADDLASTLLLATNKPVMVAPAMNVEMWHHAATQRNITQLYHDGIHFIGPAEGELACGEYGKGRMEEPDVIVKHIMQQLALTNICKGKKVLVTSGPTYEPLDPVRFLGNYSSGKQGHAIAHAFAQAGAEVTLITGPVSLSDPPGVSTHHVTTAEEMLAACLEALPCDLAVCAAAVSDWKPTTRNTHKTKKEPHRSPPSITLSENPDILATLSQHPHLRPSLVIGFAAETEQVIAHATAKRQKKQCDWILANDVSQDGIGFHSDLNRVLCITDKGCDDWGKMSKKAIGYTLVKNVQDYW